MVDSIVTGLEWAMTAIMVVMFILSWAGCIAVAASARVDWPFRVLAGIFGLAGTMYLIHFALTF